MRLRNSRVDDTERIPFYANIVQVFSGPDLILTINFMQFDSTLKKCLDNAAHHRYIFVLLQDLYNREATGHLVLVIECYWTLCVDRLTAQTKPAAASLKQKFITLSDQNI